MIDIERLYPDESSAERYFTERRWPTGVTCPRCGSVDVQRGTQANRGRQLWYCQCGNQFSVTSGTLLDSTKLPLRKWLIAFALICTGGVNARQLASKLSISYGGAWYLHKRIVATMPDGLAPGQEALEAALSSITSTRLTLYRSAGEDSTKSVYATKANEPVVKKRSVSVFGAEVTVAELAELSQRPAQSIMAQMRGGKTAEEAAFNTGPGKAVASSTRDINITDEQIRAAFAQCKTVSRTARALGIKPGTCWSRCDGLGLIANKRKVATRKAK